MCITEAAFGVALSGILYTWNIRKQLVEYVLYRNSKVFVGKHHLILVDQISRS